MASSTDADNEKPSRPLLPSPSPQNSTAEPGQALSPGSRSNLAVSPVQGKQPDPRPQEQHSPQDYDPSIGAKPYSPFYRHATPSSRLVGLALQRKRSRSRSVGVGSPIDDLEGNAPWQRLYEEETHNTATKRESKLWMPEKRYCDCLSGLSQGLRMAVKIALAVVIVGSMVGIALGITAAVGGGVWSGEHQAEGV